MKNAGAGLMRAAVLHGLRDIRIVDHPKPCPTNGDVLVKVAAAGVCGSDLHCYREGSTTGPAKVSLLVLGHELAGAITREAAECTRLPEGSLVAIDPAVPCGACEWCGRGQTNLCPHVRFLGFPPNDGGMAEYVAVPPAALHPLPAGMDAVTGVMLEPLGVAIHAMDLARPRLGETVAVIGCGTIGLLLVELARVAGAGRILAVDPLSYRGQLARRLGAHEALARVEEVGGVTAGRSADLVLEATDSPDGLELAARAARIGGRVVIVGIPDGNQYTLSAAEARRKGLTIKFSRRMPHVYPRAIALAAAGRVELAPLATHRFGLERAAEAFAMQNARADGIIKAILHP